ncbi:hypothetical protein ISS30_05785 [bacterium]|nr:hypothetical protein [bacterium]
MEQIICIKCLKSRFPNPREQCYKWGGLICTIDNSNVGKYDDCKFEPGVAELNPDFEE